MIVLLWATLGLPILSAIPIILFRGTMVRGTARWIALAGTLATLLVSLGLLHTFRSLPEGNAARNVRGGAISPVQPKFEIRHAWLTFQRGSADGSDADRVRLEVHVGLDGISLSMIVLTTLLNVACVLISWDSVRQREPEFYICLLLLETGLIGVFCAFDLMLFYSFFEFTMIPLFFLIGIWGGPQRRYAAVKFFLYTLTGSLITLVGLVAIVGTAFQSGLTSPFSIPDLAAWLQQHPIDAQWQSILFLAVAAGFMVKVPLIPLHTWLPLAHVEAPTAGSVLLAGVLLKLGAYGFLRFCLPMLPYGCLTIGLPLIGALSAAGIVYGSLCALAQRDIKKLVAYSSIAHLGFCMLGLFALNVEGISGGVLQMINHGLSTGALFLLVGMIYDRYHTRQLDDLKGLASRMPLIACAMVFISLASIGVPGLNGFVGEALSLAGMFKRHPAYAVIGATGIVLGAWYMLSMLQHVFFGPLEEPRHGDEPVHDMNLREMAALLPIAGLCLLIGVRPQPLLDLIEPGVKAAAMVYAAERPSAPRLAAGREPLNVEAAPAVVKD